MNDILVDANVIVYYYKEDVLGMDPIIQNITGSPSILFDKIIGNKDIIILDDSGDQEGMIKNEWRRNIPRGGTEWFDYWYFDLLHGGKIKFIEINVSSAINILNILYRNNFPRDKGDKWYVRTATTLIEGKCNGRRLEKDEILVHIISEDIHFFEPAQKYPPTGEERLSLLRRCDGDIPRILRNHGIELSCIENY